MLAATLAGVCLIGASLSGFASTDAATTSAADAVAAIQQVAPTAVSDVAESSSDADSAIQASLPSGDTVSVPKDPTDGVQLTGAGDAPDLTIGLPFAEQAKNAAESQSDGVVVYDNQNGSSTVPVAHADGSVQISTVIADVDAPKRYDYPITVPEGQSLQLAPDGSAFVGTADGAASVAISAAIAAPWAKDADGVSVPTHYEVHGNTLTQVIDFSEATAFPMVADPSVSFGTYVVITMSQATAQAIHGGSVALAMALLSLAGPVGVVVGAAVYGTLASYNATRLGQCKNWKFSYTYVGQLVKAGCA